MNIGYLANLLRSRHALAVIAGILLGLAFPNAGIAGFAWAAPGLILLCASGTSPGTAFRIGYLAGLAHYLTSLYWLLYIPYRWLGLPLGPAAGWLSLSAYLALYPAFWVWLMTGLIGGIEKEERPLWAPQLPSSWTHRVLLCLAAATVWVGLEMVIARLFSGFPWNLLGASQYRLAPLIQVASFTGVYGVSFVVVWLSVALAFALSRLVQEPGRRAIWIADALIPLLAIAVLFSWGFREIRRPPEIRKTIQVTFVQPSIPQTLIWDSSKDDERIQELLQLTSTALSNRTDLLIWPEAAVPKLLRYHPPTFEAISELARSNQVWMIIGADDAEPMRETPDPEDAEFYNSSFLISPEGELLDRYRKRSLVIFGEYVPLERWLPFFKWFTPVEGGFTPGDRPIPFRLDNLDVVTSVLICFEDIFPKLGREASEESDFLVNITNNGWFGEAAAQWQHAASAVFRAVENRIDLLRCSNNGITCWVDTKGIVRKVFLDREGRVYGPGFFTIELPIPEKRPPTFYHLKGDVFGWACFAVLLLLTLGRCWRVWRRKGKLLR